MPAMDSHFIKAALIENKVTQVSIALQCGVTKGMVSNVISHHSVSEPVRKAIAKAINKPYGYVWGKAA